MLFSYSFPYSLYRHGCTVVNGFLAQLDGFPGGRQVHAIDRKLTFGEPLSHADGVGVYGHHEGRDSEIVVVTLVDLTDSLGLEPFRESWIIIILRYVVDRGFSGPFSRQRSSDILHACLISAAVGDHDDVLEAMSTQ